MPRALVTAIALCLALPGCGIGENTTDPCNVERRAYDAAQKKRNQLILRGVEARDVALQEATEAERRTAENLRACEDRY